MTAVTVAGLDPGPKPGTCMLTLTPDAGDHPVGEPYDTYAVTVQTGLELAQLLEADYVAVERYVIQPRSGRSQDKGAQLTTLTMAEDMIQRALVAKGSWARLQYLGPGNVKPWATDRRLERYGLKVRGGHHRDAVRHALYLAVQRGLLPRR